MSQHDDSAPEGDPAAALERMREVYLQARRRDEPCDIDALAGGDAELAGRFRRLVPTLELLDRAGEIAEPEPRYVAPPELGEYRLVRPIGRGGMGIVYEAVQEPIGRRVALKLLPAHVRLHERQLQRFQREAQAAGRLSHPGIVPVFGVGEASGHHYFAMQHVDGSSLSEVIAELRALREARSSVDIGEEIDSGSSSSLLLGDQASGSGDWTATTSYYRNIAQLARDVARALAYAHGEGVLHRDIKPSNLMLDRDGKVWITDFGLAKIDTDDSLTHTGDILGTPRYLAPESLEGWSDPRSDVYGLGVTLYELLTLEPAFVAERRHELLEQIARRDPLAPRRRQPAIPNDLETIVLTAMEKEPGRRYSTAQAMADDLDRFLRGEPILARRATLLHRARLFVRRHRVAVTASALGSAALIVLVTAWIASLGSALDDARQERADARRNLEIALDAVDRMWTDIAWERLELEPGLEEFRTELLETALGFYRTFLERYSGDPTLVARSAKTWYKLARVQSGLQRFDAALESLERSLGLLAELPDARGTSLHIRVLLQRGFVLYRVGRIADAEAALGEGLAIGVRDGATAGGASRSELVAELDVLAEVTRFLSNQSRENALAVADRTIALADALLASDPDDRLVLRRQEQSLWIRALQFNRQRRYDDALVDLERAAQTLDAADKDRLNWQDRTTLAQIGKARGIALEGTGRSAEAQEAFRHALAVIDGLVEDHPSVTDFRSLKVDLHMTLGVVLGRESRYEEAEAELLAALRVPDPDQPGLRWRRVRAQLKADHGLLLKRLGRSADAEQCYRDAITELEALLTEISDSPTVDKLLARTYGNLGVVLRPDRARVAEVQAAYEKAAAIQRRLVGRFPSHVGYAEEMVRHLGNLAGVYIDIDLHAEAGRVLGEACVVGEPMLTRKPTSSKMLQWMAVVYQRLSELARATDDLEAALVNARAAVAMAEQALDQYPDRPDRMMTVTHSLWRVADLCSEEGRHDEALVAIERHLELRRRALEKAPAAGTYRVGLAESRLMREEIRVRAGRLEGVLEGVLRAPETDPDNPRWYLVGAQLLAQAAGIAAQSGDDGSREDFEENALSLLRRAIELGQRGMAKQLAADVFDRLREHPVFKALVAETGD